MSAHELARAAAVRAGLIPPPVERVRTVVIGRATGERLSDVTSGGLAPSQRAYADAAFAAECDRLQSAGEGTRNAALNTAAFSLGQLVGAGALDEPTVRDTLSAIALAIGLDARETALTLSSGLRAGAGQPRALPAPQTPRSELARLVVPGTVVEASTGRTEPVTGIGGPLGRATDAHAPQTPPDALLNPGLVFDARPELRALWAAARARRVGPWSVLAAALVRVVGATPPDARLPAIVGGQASLNLFVAICGHSGIGKGASEATARDAIWMPDSAEPYVTMPGSGEGIAHAYAKRGKDDVEMIRTRVIFSIPEIDTLTGTGSRSGSTLLSLLRSTWSGEPLGFTTADASKRIPIKAHSYRACLSVGVQPGRARAILDDHAGGTPQRFLWLPATDADAPDDAPEWPGSVDWSPPRLVTTPGAGHAFDVCELARAEVTADRLARLRAGTASLDGHALLARLKTAAALALLDSSRVERMTITDEDWALATHVHAVSDYTRGDIASQLSAETRAQNAARTELEAERAAFVATHVDESADAAQSRRVSRRIVEYVSEHPSTPVGIVRRDAVSSRDRDAFWPALAKLVDAGILRLVEHGRTQLVERVP